MTHGVSLLLVVLIAGCAHGPGSLEPSAEGGDEASSLLAAAKIGTPPARGPRQPCEPPGSAISVGASAYGTYHPPTEESIAGWRDLLGAPRELSRSEQHRILELAVHLGPPGADLDSATRASLRADWRDGSRVEEILLRAEIAVDVCPEEVRAVALRLGLEVTEPNDVEAVQQITAMLLATYGTIGDVPDLAWHSSLHALEAMQLGHKIQELFESPDSEIDAVDSNL